MLHPYTVHKLCGKNRIVFGAVIEGVVDAVLVVVVFADVSDAVSVYVELVRVVDERTLVDAVEDAVSVGVVITRVASCVAVVVALVWIGNVRAVV